MSEEYDDSNISYSTFWPLLILVCAMLIWAGYQDFAQNSQRSLYHEQFQGAIPAINAAQGVQTRYVALMKDLLQTSAKDPYANQIVKEATQAGLIRINPSPAGTNGTTAPAAPSESGK